MPTQAGSSAALTSSAIKENILGLLRGASLEVTSHDPAQVETCRELLPPGSEVYIAHEPKAALDDIAAQAIRLHKAGLKPVPHIVARRQPSTAALERLLDRVAGETGTDRVLVVGGDLDTPAGPFDSAVDLIGSGTLARHRFKKVGIAGHPEGHPKVADAVIEKALETKIAALIAQGIEPLIVTQFAFEAAPILAWVGKLRARGITTPVQAGLAGPAGLATLVRFALRCGVGNSLKALQSQAGRFGKLLSDAGPEGVIRELAETPEHGLAGLHFFVFGGTAKTAGWLNAAQRGTFELTGDGFKVQK